MPGKMILLLSLAGLSLLSGWLLSKASLVGRTGINLFYQEYRFLKVWWQGALVVMVGLLLWWFIHHIIEKKLPGSKKLAGYFILLMLALAGLYLTYKDFRTDLSHRLLGERFHLGAYLFWVGCLLVTMFYFFGWKKNSDRPALTSSHETTFPSSKTVSGHDR